MMYEYTPTATDLALSIYTNAIVDLRHAVNIAERERLKARASRAWAAFIRCDNPFPGWKLPEPQPESCGRCRDRVTYVERGCVFPCHCMIDEMS